MSVASIVSDYGPLVGLGGVALTLGVNGVRAERDRRRAIHARALGAVVAYLEMPYAIRRRRNEPEYSSSERVRLTDDFKSVQAELACCEVLMRADPDPAARRAYDKLVRTLRRVAGGQAATAWNSPPIERDDQIGMPELHRALEPVRIEQGRFEDLVAQSTRSALRRSVSRRSRRG